MAPRGGWSSYSHERRRRLLRTGAIALICLILLVWLISRCGGDDSTVALQPATTTSTPTTEAPRAQLATATELQVSLGDETYGGVAAAIDNKVYVLGGLNGRKQSVKTIWVLDPVTNTVTEAGALSAATHDPMGGSIGGTAFVFGGGAGNKTFDKVEAFTPGGASNATAKLPTPRTDGVAVASVTNDLLFVIGGYDGKNPTDDVLGTSDGKLFSVRAKLAQSVRYPAAAVQDGNVIWVFGGEQNNQPTDLIQKIDLNTGQAEVAGHLAQPLSHATAFRLGNSIFLAGGKSSDGLTDKIRRFEPASPAGPTTIDAGTLPTKMSDAMAATIGETVYLLGGINPKPTADIIAITAK